MNEPQPIKRKRGRPPKIRPGFKPKPEIGPAPIITEQALDRVIRSYDHAPRETPAIKEGASWHVGISEDEQDELRKRHNEEMERKANAEINKAIENSMVPEPNAVIQIKVEPNRGVLCQVGVVDGDVVHCYSLRPQGHTEYLDVKMGDFIVVAPVRTGMVAMRFEYKPKEQAPNWHEEPIK